MMRSEKSLFCCALVFTLTLAACEGDEGPGGGAAGQGGQANAGASGGAAGAGTSGGAGVGADADLLPLPENIRVIGDVVNLVDAAAAKQLEGFIQLEEGVDEVELAAQAFYATFPDDYDFLFLLTDRTLDGDVFGRYTAVRDEPGPGTGIVVQPPRLSYYSAARLAGVVGMNTLTDSYGPLLHEIAHRWGNYFDASLGFGGKDGDFELGAHWGMTSVFGQLGGFDESTLECETPAGAKPPNCTALPSGRTRYVMSDFGSNSNSFQDLDFGVLELYLMGLVPKSELPDTFTVLYDGATDWTTRNDGDQRCAVEASGIGEIKLADIIAKHGERPLAPESARHFRAAFIVVSAEPASDEIMGVAQRWAGYLAGTEFPKVNKSFEDATGGRASMSTTLGERRRNDDPLVPPEPEPEPEPEPQPMNGECDVLLQDCGPGVGCYFPDFPTCITSENLALGVACEFTYQCAPGLQCNSMECQPYCDTTAGNAKSCATLCPSNFTVVTDEAGTAAVGAFCNP